MKKLIKIGFVLALIGAIAAVLVWKFYVNKPHDDIEKATPAYSITVNEIWEKYNANLSLSDSLYTGKVVQLSGTLSRIDKTDSLVYAVFVMEADSMFGDKSVRCEMLNKYATETSTLATGSEVNIKGFCTGFDQTDVKLNKCSIVK